MREPQVTALVDGYLYRWPAPDFVEIEISDVRRKSDDWRGEMIVRVHEPGQSPAHLAETSHNLSAIQSRAPLAKTLKERWQLNNGSEWGEYLETACVMSVRAEKKGKPFIKVGALPETQRPPLWLVESMVRLNHPTSIWADGSTGKSTFAALLGLTVLTGQEIAGFKPVYSGPVMWLDWESDEWDIDDAVKAICAGHNLPPDLQFEYRRETQPLTQTYKHIANQVAREKIALVIIDSVGYALGGESEKSADALQFAAAIRALNASVLLIDHVNKTATTKAFGSVYKFNEIRLGFELTRHQEEGSAVSKIRVKCRKANKGGWPPTRWLKVTYEDATIRYEPTQPALTEAASVSIVERIRLALREATGLMNADEITAQINAHIEEPSKHTKPETVKARLSELDKAGEVYVSAAKGFARRYGLRSSRPDVEVVK